MANSYQDYTKLITFSQLQRKHYRRAVSLRGVTVAGPTFLHSLVSSYSFVEVKSYIFFCLENYRGLLTAGSTKVTTTSTLQIIAK